ncbi:hypothetical protein LY474_32405 [Myxococcus stipitatus]|uniref:hypothetical protein n=1 Tax=Myxococcus stipitatus TaxID=83455 RepID=UPI001F165C9D|nr:hypothetical protein [Myxococcus stipitatus]MCE9672520.1 hypothetical protein [Myxococcus stipitatus]
MFNQLKKMGAVFGVLFAVGFGAVANAEETESREAEAFMCGGDESLSAGHPHACYQGCFKQSGVCIYTCIMDGSAHECFEACGEELKVCLYGCGVTDGADQQ